MLKKNYYLKKFNLNSYLLPEKLLYFKIIYLSWRIYFYFVGKNFIYEIMQVNLVIISYHSVFQKII